MRASNTRIRRLAPLRAATLFLALPLGLGSCGVDETIESLRRLQEIHDRNRERRDQAQQVRIDPIFDAALKADSLLVFQLLENDPQRTTYRDPVGMTALHYAAWSGHAGIAELLIARGAVVDDKDGGGVTPLGLAVRWGNADVMRVLMAHGGRTDMRDDHGRTLLHLAAEHDHVEIMRALLDAGFDVNVMAATGTPLHSAAHSRKQRAARLLIERGGNANAVGYLGWTPLHVASCINGHSSPDSSFIRLLLDAGADPNVRDEGGSTSFMYAAQEGNTHAMALMIAHGADPGARTPDGRSALARAADAGYVDAVRMLLELGAAPDEQIPGDGILLHETAFENRLEQARLLLQKGADPNKQDRQKRTPLHSAAYRGNAEMVQLLIEFGADVDARDESKWTPLHVAAAQKQPAAVATLLEAGADPRLRTSGGESPMQLAWGTDAGPIDSLLAHFGARR